jgi:hypothetical protein
MGCALCMLRPRCLCAMCCTPLCSVSCPPACQPSGMGGGSGLGFHLSRWAVLPVCTAGVFVGYKRYDRRKQHVRELDERAQQILAAQAAAGGAMSGAESEGAVPLVPGRSCMYCHVYCLLHGIMPLACCRCKARSGWGRHHPGSAASHTRTP